MKNTSSARKRETTDATDLVEFLDEGNDSGEEDDPRSPPSWHVLIVDDDQAVHDATCYALNNTRIEGRPLHFLHAFSAGEALSLLNNRSDVAVLLLDVVMEQEHSGLELVRTLRNDLNMHAMRIILRTGQPGYAPEAEVIRDYDINDYKLKSELTHAALVTTLTSAIRSYVQICNILASQRGLSLIVDSATDLLAHLSLAEFAQKILPRLAELIGQAPEGMLFCCTDQSTAKAGAANAKVVHATGAYAPWIDKPLEQIENQPVLSAVKQCLNDKGNVYGKHAVTLFLGGAESRDAAIHFILQKPLSLTEKQLLDVFCVNVAIGLKNIGLFGDLHSLAYSDPLTGLLNRIGFIEAIDKHASNQETGWTIALIDIDHFTEVNDALGHQRGDTLLIGIARRLREYWGAGCTLARVGSDVFGLLAPEARLDPARLHEAFYEPIVVDGHLLPIESTIGLTRMTDKCGNGLELFKTTSIALKHAKRVMRGRWLYHTPDMTASALERLDLTYKLRNAINLKQGLHVHYQPQVELATGRLIGVEALLRWTTSDGTHVAPDRFIKLAEHAGLMVNLGEWVFRTAVTQIANWDAAGLPPIRLAVNLSLMQFRDPFFVGRLRKIVNELKVPAHRLELEITESIAMLDTDSVITSLNEFKAMGMDVSIDDFGTGFSSLSYLHRLPLDRLKIDRSFVQSMSSMGDSGSTIAHMVINLAHSLGLSVVAEGVESEDHALLLKTMGCEFGQGYLYSPAMPPEALPGWLDGRNAGKREHPG